MTDPDQRDGLEWERGWKGHTQAQQKRLARLSFAEKLEWLEEAQRLQVQIEESRKRHEGGGAG